MLEKLKRQSLSKLLVMGWNVVRMGLLKVRYRKSISCSSIQNIAPGTVIAIRDGKISLEHSIFTRKGVTFRAEGGTLSIGTSFFNQGCSVTAKKCISIGDNCLFGPNVVIVDHDHDYHCSDEHRGSKYLFADVTIGNNVVVGANTVILKGTCIGDNCMIGAGCVVNGEIPAGTLIYDERVQRSRPIQFRIDD